jgi:hypothetical protein
VIISTRDVIFDKNTRFDGKKENLADVLIKERDKLIKKIRIPKMLVLNERIVQEDNDLMELDKDNTIMVDTGDSIRLSTRLSMMTLRVAFRKTSLLLYSHYLI